MTSEIRQPINITSLERWLSENCPEIQSPITVLQFTFGQSNPTYLLTGENGARRVLRKKPPMKLISKKIHWIEREYTVLKSLEKSEVPVPRVYSLCCDESVLGTPFYLMEYLSGRIFEDASLPGMSAGDREDMWRDVVRTLATLHSLDIPSLDLDGFNKPVGYYERQLGVITSVTKAQAKIKDPVTQQLVGSIPHADELMSFFGKQRHRPREVVSLVHGDFKIDNIVFHKTEPRVIGILDWEISTLGHPLSDLAHLLTQQVAASVNAIPQNKAFAKGSTLGLPSTEQVLRWYSEYTGWDPHRDFGWAAAFDLFKSTVICQGIKARMATGQTNSTLANQYIELIDPLAETTRRVVNEVVQATSML